ncbi:glycosyltransferase family 9 protein [Candidatus Dependentiae bacterium]|nr:glycosyltransferase family 9 protein [Candidatus Dependentiae bacterium]
MNERKKILIIRLGAIGDIIRTLPAVKYLSENLKEEHQIFWLTEKQNSNILENLSYINKLVKIPRKEWQKQIFSKNFLKVIFDFKNIIKDLKNEKFDYVLDFHGIFKSGLLSYLTNCPVRIGYSKKFCKELNHIFNNVHIDAESDKITRIEKNFSLLAYFFNKKIKPEKFGDLFEIKENDKIVTENFIKKLTYKNIILINPAVSKIGRYKEWPEKYYSKLCILLAETYKETSIVFSWGPGEFEKIERIINGIKNISNSHNNRIFTAPATTVKESVYLISKASLFITGDTGPMHIASLLNIQLVALFGPSDPEINKPYGKNNIVLYKNTGCNPCRKRKCKKLICQANLDPNFVFEKILTYYKKIELD